MHAVECHSALKKEEILHSLTGWVNLDDSTLSEISQSEKDKYCLIYLIIKCGI